MHFTAVKNNLLIGINAVQKIIPSRAVFPYLTGMKIKAAENNLEIYGTDMKTGILARVPAEIIEEGEIIIPGKQFSDFIRFLPDETIEVQNMENVKGITIKYRNAEVNIKGWEEEYPSFEDFRKDFSFSLSYSLFENMIKQSVFACSSDDTRPVFTGVLLSAHDDEIEMVATDTHRLVLRKGKTPVSDNEVSFIVPAKALLEVSRIMKDENEFIKVSGNDSQVVFENENKKIYTKLIEGKYPDHRQVIPKEFKTEAVVRTSEIRNVIERAGLFTEEAEGFSYINMVFSEDRIKIYSNSETGNFDEETDAYVKGEEIKISFNTKYLLDVLKNIDAENVSFYLTGDVSAAVVKPKGYENYTYLLLPLRK